MGSAAEDDRRPVAVVVAHPDDETLWAGGTLLGFAGRPLFVACLCRGSDPDRAPRSGAALRELGAEGRMADVDDSPEQPPLSPGYVRDTVRRLLPEWHFGVVMTHGPGGEYTRHRRHEEVGKAARELWLRGSLRSAELWLFAYDDGGGVHLPRAADTAHRVLELPASVWERKRRIITETYGFAADSFEARTTPRAEAFWCFRGREDLRAWLQGDSRHEGAGAV
jgi:LmbE family N-acetylglucosaminyl deacetylase